MPSTWWTEDRTETLRQMWASGFSFSDIAAEIGGGATRCSIGGKVFRLKLNGRRFVNQTKKTPEEIEATKRAKMARRNERRRTQPVSLVMVKRINLEALRCIEVDPQHKSLIELDYDGCRYPFGDNPFTFCNHTQFEGSSYCGPHLALTRRSAS